MSPLSISHIEAGYANKTILKDFGLEVGDKETLIIMGPSGSGKTTLLLTILGIIMPVRGEVLLNGNSILHLPIEGRGIGYLPQDYGLFPHLNVVENVAYGLRVRGVPKNERHKVAQEMLQLVNIEGLDNRKISEISGGQRQRVGLARALATRPKLLLLDEPLSNIDQVTKAEVAKHLKGLFEKLEIPVLLVTHNHEDAVFLAQRLAIMIDGRIEQTGSVREILNAPKSPFIRRLLSPFAEERLET